MSQNSTTQEQNSEDEIRLREERRREERRKKILESRDKRMKFIMGQAETPTLKQTEIPQEIPESPIEEPSAPEKPALNNSTFKILKNATFALFVSFVLYISPGANFFTQFLYWISAWFIFEVIFLGAPKLFPNSNSTEPVKKASLEYMIKSLEFVTTIVMELGIFLAVFFISFIGQKFLYSAS